MTEVGVREEMAMSSSLTSLSDTSRKPSGNGAAGGPAVRSAISSSSEKVELVAQRRSVCKVFVDDERVVDERERGRIVAVLPHERLEVWSRRRRGSRGHHWMPPGCESPPTARV
jgi:hypothetical protein